MCVCVCVCARVCVRRVCDLETSRMGAPYIYDISRLRVNEGKKRKIAPVLINYDTMKRREEGSIVPRILHLDTKWR